MVNQTKLRCLEISIIVPAFQRGAIARRKSLAQIKSAADAFAQRGWDFELIVCATIPPTARPKSRERRAQPLCSSGQSNRPRPEFRRGGSHRRLA